MRCKKLAVSAAFHSELVAGAEGAFAAAVAGVKISAGRMVVFANTTGGEYPADAAAAGRLLAGQLARPVEFVKQIEEMYAAGVRTFLEVGPGGKLSGLVRAILQGREFDAIAVDVSGGGGGKRSGIFDLGCVLGQLAALGHGVDLTRWDGDFARRVAAGGTAANKKPAMAVALSGANYVKPRPARAAAAGGGCGGEGGRSRWRRRL